MLARTEPGDGHGALFGADEVKEIEEEVANADEKFWEELGCQECEDVKMKNVSRVPPMTRVVRPRRR